MSTSRALPTTPRLSTMASSPFVERQRVTTPEGFGTVGCPNVAAGRSPEVLVEVRLDTGSWRHFRPAVVEVAR